MPVEVNLAAYRFAKQNDLSTVDYHDMVMDNIDEVTDKRLRTLKEIEKDKTRVARAYNNFRLVTWFGRRFCQLVQRITNLANGLRVGRVITR